MKIEFEKQFGEGVDPWYEKARRYVKKGLDEIKKCLST